MSHIWNENMNCQKCIFDDCAYVADYCFVSPLGKQVL